MGETSLQDLAMVIASDFLDFLWDGELQQLMLMACPDGVVVSDPGERIVLYSGASEFLFGYTPAEVLGKPVGLLFGARGTDRELRDRVRQEGSVANLEVRAFRKDSQPFWAGVSASALRDRYGESIGTVFYVRDHSRIRAIQADLLESNDRLNGMLEELHHVASHDGLTGLLNRGSAMTEAETKFMNARPTFGVAIFDLDYFKQVNDTYGHMAGDEVLIRVAELIRNTARGDDIIGRYGGEEFVGFLPGADINAIRTFAERTRMAVEREPIRMSDGLSLNVTISAGVATIPSDAMDLRAALRLADDRLYEAKRLGRNQVVATGHPPIEGRNAA